MRKVYTKCFYVPQHGYVGDHVMLTRAVITVLVTVICLFSMSISAYAYFSYDVTSDANRICCAKFDVFVSVLTETGDTVSPDRSGVFSLPNGRYTVQMETDGTASTGFCTVSVQHGDKQTVLVTEQINRNNEKPHPTLTFTLAVTESVEISVTPHWGSSAYYKDASVDSEEIRIPHQGTVSVTDGTVIIS